MRKPYRVALFVIVLLCTAAGAGVWSLDFPKIGVIRLEIPIETDEDATRQRIAREQEAAARKVTEALDDARKEQERRAIEAATQRLIDATDADRRTNALARKESLKKN